MIRSLQRSLEVINEGDIEVLELCLQAGVEFIFGLLGIVDGGFVAEMVEVAGCY